jgi:hypothetical protein
VILRDQSLVAGLSLLERQELEGSHATAQALLAAHSRASEPANDLSKNR